MLSTCNGSTTNTTSSPAEFTLAVALQARGAVLLCDTNGVDELNVGHSGAGHCHNQHVTKISAITQVKCAF